MLTIKLKKSKLSQTQTFGYGIRRFALAEIPNTKQNRKKYTSSVISLFVMQSLFPSLNSIPLISSNLYGSKDSTRAAFKAGLLGNGDVWMGMIVSRNITSHTYDDTTADNIVSAIHSDYFSEFKALKVKLDALTQEENAWCDVKSRN